MSRQFKADVGSSASQWKFSEKRRKIDVPFSVDQIAALTNLLCKNLQDLQNHCHGLERKLADTMDELAASNNKCRSLHAQLESLRE